MEMSIAEKVRGLLEVNNSSYDMHLVYIYVADLEGACGASAPPPKIRKAYVIQR